MLLVFGAAVLPDGEPSPLLRRRLLGAVEAAARCRAPLFLVTGGRGAAGRSEADAMHRTLLKHGVPADAISCEPRSRDTLEQARRCAAILDRLGRVDRVLVCTSAWHQPRCRLLLRLLGVRAEAAPMPPDRPHMSRRRWGYYVAREIAATAWDASLLVGLLAVGRGPLPDPG